MVAKDDTALKSMADLLSKPEVQKLIDDVHLMACAFRDQMMKHISEAEEEYLESWDLTQVNRSLTDPQRVPYKDTAEEMAFRVYVCSKYLSAPISGPLMTVSERMAITDAALDMMAKFSKALVAMSLVNVPTVDASGNS